MYLIYSIFLVFVLVYLYRIIESTYILVFNRPLYVHFYLILKKLDASQLMLLEKEFRFYNALSPSRKKYFGHRVHQFITTYNFLGSEGLEVTGEMKLKIAATYVMLTFGMRDYLTRLFNVIILFPDSFQSGSGNLHKGEFNPSVKAVVFSWKHFQEGLEFGSDNLNLGLHEFAHVLHFHLISKRRKGSSAVIYSDMFDKVMEYLAEAKNRENLLEINYFREYAYTNRYEFIAVVLEYFFETPQEFKQKLPELYRMVKKMINFRKG